MNNKTEELIGWDQGHVVHSAFPFGQNRGIVMDHAKGICFYDTDGKQYIDAASQLLCVNLGWGQQDIVNAIKTQSEKLQYGTMFFGLTNSAALECSHILSEVVPAGMDHFVYTSGGSESNEVAFKITRLYNGLLGSRKHKIISLADAYHGVTVGTGNATGTSKGLFDLDIPRCPGYIQIPSYYCYRCMLGKEYPSCNIDCAQYLARVIEKAGPQTVAAFIGEPVLGVAGCISPPPEYWPIIRKICTEYDVLLIADEVMTGFCRTGKMFALENWGVTPDIMATAKGITSSYIPFGAVAFSDKIYNVLKEKNANFCGFTFGGHPIGAAAATAAINVYLKDKIADHVNEVGEYARKRLEEQFRPLPCVDDISGLGLMLSMEIVADKTKRKPFAYSMGVLPTIQKKALVNGLFIRISPISNGPGDRIPFAPPLIATKGDVDKALDILYPLVANLKPT